MEENKKPVKKIKIAGFTFTSKQIKWFIVAVIFIVLFSMAQSNKKKKEIEDKMAEEEARIAAALAAQGGDEMSLHDQIQASLRERFGEPPEGFEWDYSGELVALSDSVSTCEDVVFTYLRSLSMLDFSTAQRYSSKSYVAESYQDYYSISGYTDYYDNFLRKQFKLSISSLEVVSVSEVAVFADGTQYVTVKVKALNLEDKDFWQSDRDYLFETMRSYKETEDDDVKMETFLYDYMLQSYEDGKIGKREYTVELVVSKANSSGWLISDDKELDSMLRYERGLDVAQYIKNEFITWNRDKSIEEATQNREG